MPGFLIMGDVDYFAIVLQFISAFVSNKYYFIIIKTPDGEYGVFINAIVFSFKLFETKSIIFIIFITVTKQPKGNIKTAIEGWFWNAIKEF